MPGRPGRLGCLAATSDSRLRTSKTSCSRCAAARGLRDRLPLRTWCPWLRGKTELPVCLCRLGLAGPNWTITFAPRSFGWCSEGRCWEAGGPSPRPDPLPRETFAKPPLPAGEGWGEGESPIESRPLNPAFPGKSAVTQKSPRGVGLQRSRFGAHGATISLRGVRIHELPEPVGLR